MTISVFDTVENILGKGGNAGNQHFLLFPQCFQKVFSQDRSMSVLGGKELRNDLEIHLKIIGSMIISYLAGQFFFTMDVLCEIIESRNLTHYQTTKYYTGPNWKKLQTTF